MILFLWLLIEFFKMVHFIPCSQSIDASHMTKLFFKKTVRLRGLPTMMVS